MIFDISLIRRHYAGYGEKVDAARKNLHRPLTLAEKILYAHLCGGADADAQEPGCGLKRGESYAFFAPDRVAMQDATAQMAVLQFMNAGRERVAVPTTVHCDHLICACDGVEKDLSLIHI